MILGAESGEDGQFRADVHVKTHGYARGGIPRAAEPAQRTCQGLFEHDGGPPAVVRFSNSANHPQADAIPDGRGMAIKVLGVEGEIVLVDEQRGPDTGFRDDQSPGVFRPQCQGLSAIGAGSRASGRQPARDVAGGPYAGATGTLFHWHWREMLTVARIAGQLPAHPASNTYFSMAPIRFGNYVAKYRAKPTGDRHDSYLDLIQRFRV